MPEINKYPGLFFIDAHQNSGSYFFPPNEDPVHHEISHFALDFIQNRIGPAIQQKFNDQSINYRNYFQYDLFTPEYGDTVPALLMGAAGMTFEQPTGDAYGRQIYQHFLAIDTTVNVTSRDKVAAADGLDRAVAGVDRPGRSVRAAGEQARQPAPQGQSDDRSRTPMCAATSTSRVCTRVTSRG